MEVVSGDNWSCKSCKAPVKCHHQQTDTQLFTGRMPFLSPNQQCESTEGKTTEEKPQATRVQQSNHCVN